VANNVLSEELDNLLPGDFREWHCLALFGEVVGDHQQEPQLELCSGELSDYIMHPLHEGLRVAQGVEVSTRSV